MSDFTSKSDTELRKELRENRQTVRSFKFAIAGSGQHSPDEYRQARKNIARILTELRHRELAEK